VALAGIRFFLKSGTCASRSLRRSMTRVSWGLSCSLVRKYGPLPFAVI